MLLPAPAAEREESSAFKKTGWSCLLCSFTPESAYFTATGAFIASISSFLFGYCLSEMNTIAPFIVLTFDWCEADSFDCDTATFYESMTNAILFVGAAVGAYITGPLMSRYKVSVRHVLCLASCFFIC